jgi:hypothetical protein
LAPQLCTLRNHGRFLDDYQLVGIDVHHGRSRPQGRYLYSPFVPTRFHDHTVERTDGAITGLSIRQIQSKIAGRASRGIVGEITKRARVTQPPPCDHFLHVSSTYPRQSAAEAANNGIYPIRPKLVMCRQQHAHRLLLA